MNNLWWARKNLTFNYKDGIVFTDNLSEELDNMTVVLPFIGKQDFEPFDIVEIRNDKFATKTMLIANVDESQVDVDRTQYNYTLSLMSLTKGLERIPLPNFSVTRRQERPKTIQSVLNDLVRDYSPKCIINNRYIQLYSIVTDSRLNIECPEMQMSKPTLREAIDRLLSAIFCICYVDENHVVQILDLNQKNNPINTDLFNYKDESQSATDYASELENQYNNVTPIKGEEFKNYVLTTEYIGFRNATQAVMADNNLKLTTSKPIYLIKKVIMCASVKPLGTNVYRYLELDITNQIYESQEYNALDSNTRWTSVFYNRGSNLIDGWNNEKQWGLVTRSVKETLVQKALSQYYGMDMIQASIDNWIRDVMFKIEYYAQDNTVRAKSGKYLPETNENNIIVDNPSEMYVDIKRQGELFNQKVNRLGNRAKIMTGRFTDPTLIPVLGDYYNDYIVMNRELSYFDNYINVKLTLTEYFTNINYFTGINARRRSWQIESAGQAFDKQLLDKTFCEFSFSQKSGPDNINLQQYSVIPSLYLLNVFSYDPKPIKHVLITNEFLETDYSDIDTGLSTQSDAFTGDENFNYVELEMSSYISGNSLIFNYGFEDNYSANLSLSDNETGGVSQKYNPYTDDNGECYYYDIFLCGEILIYPSISNLNNGSILYDGTAQPVNSIYQKLQNLSALKPRIAIDDINDYYDNCFMFHNYVDNTKDNREKIKFNTQFEFCSDTKDIVIGRKFLERQRAISELGMGNNINNSLTFTHVADKTVTQAGIVHTYFDEEFEIPNFDKITVNSYSLSNIKVEPNSQIMTQIITQTNNKFRVIIQVYANTSQTTFITFTINYTYTYGGYKIYKSTLPYKPGDQKIHANSSLRNSIFITTESVNNATSKIRMYGGDSSIENQKSIAIGDNDGNLILAVNTPNAYLPDIYLNMLKTRDRKNYTNTTLKYLNS